MLKSRCIFDGVTPNLPIMRHAVRKSNSEDICFYIITKSMRTLWLVNQLWFIVPANSWKNFTSSELLYKKNRPQVSMVYLQVNRHSASE